LGVGELKTFAGKFLSKYKLPEEIVFVEHIPRNSTRMILRLFFRAEVATEVNVKASESSPEDPKPKIAWHYLTFLSARIFVASKPLGQSSPGLRPSFV